MLISLSKKWVALLLGVGVLMHAPVVCAASIDAINDLQKQRVKVCEELSKQDGKAVVDELKETGKLIETQIQKSGDPETMRRTYASATRKLTLIYQADKLRKPQLNYITDVYRATLAGLRVQYRNEIRNQVLVEKNPKADFFEMDCKKLKK